MIHQGLRLDFRDDSYVVLDREVSYLGRIRSWELLFSPDRLADQPALPCYSTDKIKRWLPQSA